MVAGPSEILIIADKTANPAYVAADLLSQAEHDPLAASILLTTDPELPAAVLAEIERQMIRQRTKEGLRLRMKLGVMLGRPPGIKSTESIAFTPEQKEKIIEQYNWGVPERRLAANFNIDRNTLSRWLHRWGIKYSAMIERQERQREQERQNQYKDGDYQVLELTDEQRYELQKKIECDLTVPQIWETMKEYTYEQLYDTILCDADLNALYRKHGHLKVKKGKH
jgi:transposase-like protein